MKIWIYSDRIAVSPTMPPRGAVIIVAVAVTVGRYRRSSHGIESCSGTMAELFVSCPPRSPWLSPSPSVFA